MLCERFPPASLAVLPREAWRPCPPIDDRAAWEAIPRAAREAHLARAEASLARSWPALPATLYLEFARNGDRGRFEGPYFERRALLSSFLLAECLEDRGRFLDGAADCACGMCEESSWCIPAHVGFQRAGPGLPDVEEPVVDLFAAETAAAIAWTVFLLGHRLDRVSPLLRPRLTREARRRVIEPFLAREDWFWMGFAPGHGRPNNWNPWINSNVLAAGLLLEDGAERRRAIVARAMRSLDRFLDPYPRDGGCDEGPSYWGRAGASAFDCLETLSSVTAGQLDAWDEPLVREIGRFIARAQIAGPWYVNFADSPALVSPPAGVVFRFGERIGDRDLARLGASLHRRAKGRVPDGHGSPERALRELFLTERIASAEASEPLPRDVWLPEVQVMVARDAGGSARGLCVAAKGGHNAESHNHNDIGSFVVYTDGRPAIVDAGVGEYTRATFSAQRYSIWTMQSASHSLLPTVDGAMQAPGAAFAARGVSHSATEGEAWMELDIAGAYPPEAGIRSWRRRVTLRRGIAVEIEDVWDLAARPREITLSLLTPCAVLARGHAVIELGETGLPQGLLSGRALLAFGAEGVGPLGVTVARVPLEDGRLAAVWGRQLERIVLSLREPAPAGRLRLEVRAR
jgi:hypothetical protein